MLSPRRRAPLWLGRALPGLALVLVAAAVACSAFGLALGALGLRMRDVFLISNVASSALLLLTGANVPRQSLPGWMRTTGDVLPLTHAADAARRLADGGGIAWGPVGAECAVGVGYALLAVVLLAVFERGSRRRATLDVM